jgi:hypothetical protein
MPPKRSGRKYDQQTLSDTQIFARALLDIYFSFSDEAIYGQLPLEIIIEQGKDSRRKLSYNPSPAILFENLSHHGIYNRKRIEFNAGRRLHSPTRNLKHDNRWVLANVKRNTFLLMFIIASGANLTPLLSLTNGDVKTVPAGADQTIYKFKHRASHEVNITIYDAFKPILKHYQKWRDELFVGELENPWLFPSLNSDCSVTEFPSDTISSLRNLVLKLNVPWQPPKIIRRTFVNWAHRYFENPILSSEMSSHSIETFFRSYHAPNHQRAIAETQSFWKNFDPASLSVIGGNCNGKPIPVKNLNTALAKPNCILPSGCLFCENHKDIDSSDYVWSLVSFRFLKLLEAGNSSLSKDSRNYEPVDLIVNRVTDKLEAFKMKRAQWVEDAILRVTNDDFHPSWVHLIDMCNGIEG